MFASGYDTVQPDGIRVTQVDPGIVDTPMAAAIIRGLSEAGASVNIAGRAGEPDAIAALVHYLVAPAGRFANGRVLQTRRRSSSPRTLRQPRALRDQARRAAPGQAWPAAAITRRSSPASSCFSSVESSRTISPS